ncbi:MAG: PhoH family protein [Fluviicoccus sp.]|uniref:PhoH family protein n=1 Tax=Fluviicoccus sp. TaxID=2003552 RepID=UPI002715A88A|nr:PhoH family protein [Fluviicoccus sp.]MDO8331974.1 PhoH family protein [Fluviicoccus sp.]
MIDHASASRRKAYVIDTNVLIHDPNSVLQFEEHRVIIPMTVLEELDKLKSVKAAVAGECRAAIRLIDRILGEAEPERIRQGVPIFREPTRTHLGTLSVLMDTHDMPTKEPLSNELNDNKIINQLVALQAADINTKVVLVTKDINMRLKARACGLAAEDYHNDQLVSDIKQLSSGCLEIEGSFWNRIKAVDTLHRHGEVLHFVPREYFTEPLFLNQFVVDDEGFTGIVREVTGENVVLADLKRDALMHRQAWGLQPRNLQQALALHLLMDPFVHLVSLTGAAGSGKTILALAAAIEMTVVGKRFNKIIATRSTPPLAEEHGFLPGTEEEKMDPWLGAISDNIEALHLDDHSPSGSIQYVKEKANIQFKALNYIRGRSFQKSLILIDECQNLTPYQMKAIITRAGEGSKVVCLGNLAQIDTPWLSATSSGLTYMCERFKGFRHGGHMRLEGVPRSVLAEYAEANL